MSASVEISVVVPVFRGENTLVELDHRLREVLSSAHKDFEVIYVHDGGSDAAWEVVKELGRNPGHGVKAVRLSKNYGQNAATLCGLSLARGQQVITIDEDLQTPPEEIGKLLDLAAEGNVELIYGIPEKSRQSMIRRLGSAMTKRFFQQIEGIDIGSSFRWMSRALIDRMEAPKTEHLFINQVVNWYTDRIGFVKVRSAPRTGSKSGYSLGSLAKVALRLLLFYSDFPLRLMIWFGLFVSIVCMGFGAYFLYLKLAFGAVLGFTSIIVAIFFSAGIIITCLSVIGLYIQRIFKNQMGRPVYAIEEVLP